MCYMSVKLSIILPVYNVEQYITICLQSIFNQSIPTNLYEVIVVNDGSRDKSMEIVKEFAVQYNNLQIITQENKGLSVARNIGLSIAKGEYIWFIDSDDWISANAFDIIMPNLKLKNDVIATNLIYTYDDESKNFDERKIKKETYASSREYFNNFSVGAAQRYIIRRDFLADINLLFTEGIYHEDAEFGAILIYKANTILVLKDNIYHYYQREYGSIMSNWKTKNSIDYLKVFENLSIFQDKIVVKEDKDFFNWYLFRLLVQAFPLKSLNNQKEIKELYLDKKWQLRRDAFSCLKFNTNSLKRCMAIFSYILSPLIYLKLLSFIKGR